MRVGGQWFLQDDARHFPVPRDTIFACRRLGHAPIGSSSLHRLEASQDGGDISQADAAQVWERSALQWPVRSAQANWRHHHHRRVHQDWPRPYPIKDDKNSSFQCRHVCILVISSLAWLW